MVLVFQLDLQADLGFSYGGEIVTDSQLDLSCVCVRKRGNGGEK